MTLLHRAVVGWLLSAAALAQDPSSSTDPFESRFKVKPNFQLKFRVPEKGGEVRLFTTNPARYEKDVFWEGSGDVTIEYQDVKITAQKARYDFRTEAATLEGNVVIDQGPTRLSASRAVFQVKSKTGTLENARADLAPAYHVIARTIEKIGEATYRIRDGLFTACDVPNPEWSFFMQEATITLDDYARMKGVSFRAGRVPLLYTPYIVWPTKADRATGMLVPGVGFSNRRGGYLGLTHYWVTGRATDATTQLDLFSGGTIGLGEEFRWTPTPLSAGIFNGYLVRDTEATACVDPLEEPEGFEPCVRENGRVGVFARRERIRWKVRLDHESEDLPWGFRGVVAIREYSDEQFLQDFERSFALSSARQVASNAFLTKNFGEHSVNVRVERTETFFGRTVVQERLPSVEYARRTSRIGSTPLWLALESSLSYLGMDRGRGLPEGRYGRFDVHPVISLPWKTIPWLSVTARGGGRFTGYTDSLDAAQTQFAGETADRSYGETGLSIVGPSFSRIFDGAIGPYGRFKHVIEPRVEYEYVSEVDDPLQIPIYDEVDTPLGRNQIRYALVNRLLARRADPKAGSAEELASLEISQRYAFEPPQTLYGSSSAFDPVFARTGPVEAALRVSPAGLFQLDGRVSYDTSVGRVTASSLTVAVSVRSNYLNATYFGSRPVAPPGPTIASAGADQIRLAAGADLGKLFRVETQLNYDAKQNLMLEDRSLLQFRGSCFDIFFELRQLRLPPDTRRDYRVVINLKDIGTLLDVNGSLDRIF